VPPFPKPAWDAGFPVDTAGEVEALRAHARLRGIPKRAPDRLLLATWNIANLGLQKRTDPADYTLLAEVVRWFDVVAIQEVNDNLDGLRAVKAQLPAAYRILFSDASGNRERGAFVYDSRKVRLLDKIGRLSIPPSQLPHIRLPDSQESFPGFDRGPYMAAFQAREFRFLLINVHLYFGGDNPADMGRRALETYAVAWWAQRRHKSRYAYVPDIMPLGDFNLPMLDERDPIYRALKSRGLTLPAEHRISQVGGSSLQGLKHYDQVAFFPNETTELAQIAVFDFDNVLFRDVFERRTLTQYLAYTRFHISDHRPLWAEFDLSAVSAPASVA
jgi:endonuclease/exonuclease/phosphatase family metal-dependent hydrolase